MNRQSVVLVTLTVLLLAACTPGAQDAAETTVPSAPTVEAPTATPTVTDSGQPSTLDSVDCAAAAPGMAEWVACNIVDGIVSRNLSALHGYMADPFVIGYWGSEGRSDSPQAITAELQQSRLPADPASPMTFTTDASLSPPLGGTPAEEMLGPEIDVVMVVYSEGWGAEGLGAVLLLIAQDDSGEYYWPGMIYSEAHFDE